jgi:hypothetical protein
MSDDVTVKKTATSNPNGSEQSRFPFQFRLPKPSRKGQPGEVDPWFSGNRSFWNERVLATPRNSFRPEVKSIVVKQHGKRRGCRFILFESAKLFFDKLRAEQEVA